MFEFFQRFLGRITSQIVDVAATYSASYVDKDIIACFFKVQQKVTKPR